MRLQAKLSLSLLAVLAVLGVGLLALAARTSQLYQQEVQQRLNDGLAAHIVEEYPLLRSQEVNDAALEELFHQLMVVNPAIEVYLLDPEGRILAFSAPTGRVERKRVSLAPIESLVRGRASYPVLGDDPRDLDGQKVFDAAPVRHLGRLEGYLYIVLAGEAYDSTTGMLGRSYILRLSAWIGVGILLVSLAVAAVLTRRFTRPLERLDRRMSRFTAAELDDDHPREVEPGGDEVSRLEESFIRMSERIREQIAELQRGDRLRRELVASVSHDLRTPLTHLQGYLDTLRLKGDSLSAEECNEYVEIATRHAERLGRLVNDLFELAKLDALKAPVRIEEFNLAELARDVVDKYRLAAERGNVRMEVSGAEGLSGVVADPGLIERALENLVDNALRHTPSGGHVVVSLAEQEDGGATVRVRDTGEGIPREDQGRIFDRFYRGARRDGEGTGLGLAVAKRAVELHRGRLRVRSDEGSGSTFIFDIPAPAPRAGGRDRDPV